jgi:hypothetical protein
VFFLITYFTSKYYYAILISYILNFVVASSIQTFRFKLNFKSLSYSSLIKFDEKELLNLGLANATNTTLITITLTNISVVSFGAFQAFRSIANFLPFILQYLETHYSNTLLANKEKELISKNKLLIFILIIICLISFVFFNHTQIVSFLFGFDYVQYSDLLIFLVVLVFIQSISRLLTVELRLKNKLIAFNYSSYVLWLSSLVLLSIYLFSILISFKSALILLIVTSLIQFINYCFYFIKYKSEK